MTGTEHQELLERRARELARPVEVGDARGATRTVMRFRLGDERYAVALDAVRELVALTGAARLPRAAWPLVALAPVAGRVVPVAELGGPGPADGLPAWGVAVEGGGQTLCLPADEVTDLAELAEADVSRQALGDSGPREHVRGLTRGGDVLIDVDGLLAWVRGRRTDSAGETDEPTGRDG